MIAACTLAARQNARTAARRLHAQLAGVAASLDPIEPREVIESLLGAEAQEDLVAVYRQTAFELLLVARGRSTPGYG